MDNLISKNYQQMISIPGSQNNELNKFFEMIDNLNKPIEFNKLKFDLNIRDENGNSILHRIIINSLNEQELLLKIEFIPNIETLINTVNFKQQTPLHLLCKYQYYESYLLLKNTLEGSDIDYLKEENEINKYLKSKSVKPTKKDKGIDIRYDILDYKNRLPLSYLVVGVDIDKIKCKCSDEATKAINDFKNFDKNNLNSNKMKQIFYECTFAKEDFDKDKIKEQSIDNNIITNLIINIKKEEDNKIMTNAFIHNLILNNKFIYRYINEEFFTDVVNKTIKKVDILKYNINVDGMYDLRYFITIDESDPRKIKYLISEIKSLDYYINITVYIFNKIIGHLKYTPAAGGDPEKYEIDKNSTLTDNYICNDVAACAGVDKNNKETYKQKVIKQYEEIIETKTSLINKVFMDNQKYIPPV